MECWSKGVSVFSPITRRVHYSITPILKLTMTNSTNTSTAVIWRDLAPLMNPRSVAIIGASQRSASALNREPRGNRVIRNLKSFGYPGQNRGGQSQVQRGDGLPVLSRDQRDSANLSIASSWLFPIARFPTFWNPRQLPEFARRLSSPPASPRPGQKESNARQDSKRFRASVAF